MSPIETALKTPVHPPLEVTITEAEILADLLYPAPAPAPAPAGPGAPRPSGS